MQTSSVDYLVRYLYRTQPIYPEQIHFTRVDDNYISGEWNALTTRSHHKDKIAEHFIKRILSYDSANTLLYYLDNTTDPENWRYYRRKVEVVDGEPVFVYRREDTVIEASYSEIPGVIFQEIDLHDYHLHGRHNVYYDLEKNAMYLRTVKEAIVYDGMPYNSDHIDKLPNNHVYYMNFIDEEGWGGYGWDQFWKSIFNGIMNSLIDAQDRQFRLQYNIGTGKIPYYPELIIGSGSRLRPFKLIYEFLDGHQDPHGLQQRFLDNNYNHKKSLDPIQDHHAIHLEFPTVFGLLAFTNKLFFRNGMNSSIDLDRPPGRYLRFMEVYEEIITTAFQELNSSIDNSYLLKLLYFIPEGALKLIGKDALWGFLETVVEEYITNVRTDKEDIVMKVIQTLGEMYETSDEFLNLLLDKKVDKIPLLSHFSTRFDGDNFTRLVELVRTHWLKSSYSSIDPEINKTIKFDGTSPILIPYASDKTIGFHHDNATIKWTGDYSSIFVYFQEEQLKAAEEGKEKVKNAENPEEIFEAFEEVFNAGSYNYHPYAMIAIVNEDNPEFTFKDRGQEGSTFQIMPAYTLFAHTSRAWWSNLATAAEYAADILSSFSGIGNILKAGKLFTAFKAGKKLILKSKAFTKFVIGARKASGYLELTAGIGNGLLKLTGARDTPLGREVSKILFYLEMAALGGEITAALHGSIRKAAQNALKNTDEVTTIIKNAEETILKNLDESGNLKRTKEAQEAAEQLDAIKQLEEFAGSSYLEKVSGRGRRFGQRITKSQMKKIKKALKKMGVELEILPEKGAHSIPGFFLPNGNPVMIPENAAAIFITDGTKMTMVLREKATIYEFFHEFMHFRHSQSLGLKNYYDLGGKGTLGELTRETWVFDKIIENSNFFTKDEIEHAAWYINDRVRHFFGKGPLDIATEIIPEIRKEVKIEDLLQIK